MDIKEFSDKFEQDRTLNKVKRAARGMVDLANCINKVIADFESSEPWSELDSPMELLKRYHGALEAKKETDAFDHLGDDQKVVVSAFEKAAKLIA